MIKVGFDVRYGHNEIEIPVNGGKLYADNAVLGLSNLNGETFTIINAVPESPEVPAKAAWKKFTLAGCGKRSGLYDKSSGEAVYKANAWTAYIKNWQQYKKPVFLQGGYYALADGEKQNYFTANVGDLLIFADIPDAAPGSLHEFHALRDKYKDIGGVISGTEEYISYKPDGTPWATNHIECVSAGADAKG